LGKSVLDDPAQTILAKPPWQRLALGGDFTKVIDCHGENRQMGGLKGPRTLHEGRREALQRYEDTYTAHPAPILHLRFEDTEFVDPDFL
jgi:hypothetical protein